MSEEMFAISKQQAEAILNYLATKPWQEADPYINIIRTLQPVNKIIAPVEQKVEGKQELLQEESNVTE